MEIPKQSGLRHWLENGWRAAEVGERPLHIITGQLPGGTTMLLLLGPENRFGARYFQIARVLL